MAGMRNYLSCRRRGIGDVLLPHPDSYRGQISADNTKFWTLPDEWSRTNKKMKCHPPTTRGVGGGNKIPILRFAQNLIPGSFLLLNQISVPYQLYSLSLYEGFYRFVRKQVRHALPVGCHALISDMIHCP